MENNLIISNDSYKLIAAGALMTILALNNVNSTYTFKSNIDMYKEASNMNSFSGIKIKSNIDDNLLIKSYNCSLSQANSVHEFVENDQEVSVDNSFKKRKVKIIVKNRRKYVPFFDFEEVFEEL